MGYKETEFERSKSDRTDQAILRFQLGLTLLERIR